MNRKRGWKRDSYRHGLSARGVKTKQKVGARLLRRHSFDDMEHDFADEVRKYLQKIGVKNFTIDIWDSYSDSDEFYVWLEIKFGETITKEQADKLMSEFGWFSEGMEGDILDSPEQLVEHIEKYGKVQAKGMRAMGTLDPVVLHQYEAIRRMGQTNMLDKTMVQRIAYENGFYDLVNAIEEGYSKILNNYDPKMVKEDQIPKVKRLVTRYELVEDDEDE